VTKALASIKLLGAAVALATFIFGVFQFYSSELDKKRERATEQVQRHEEFLASENADIIASQFDNKKGGFDLTKYADKTSKQYRALLFYFNLLEGITYLYNVGAIDADYTEGNLLCAVIRHYRIFVLGQTGQHGVVVAQINNGGLFKVGLFENVDKVYNKWNQSTFRGLSVDSRCAAVWNP
jgi:hypothetical protein